MNDEVRRLFQQLVSLPEEQQSTELEKVCADAEIRSQVLTLLQADARTDGIIEGPIQRAASELAGSAALRLGVWETSSLLGQGGMGVVYLAHRSDGSVDQSAAIKLLYRGFETEDLLRRFQRERSILARLTHPGIARLLDAGATPEGRPWFAMEYVAGVALDRYCESNNLKPEERVRLLIEACQAVQHAHQHLVIHRDIKPDNILVDGEGRLRLLDFGIAQIIGESATDRAATRAMTPDYASPEQLRGEHATTATDVYLLGAVLLRLLGDPGKDDLGNIVRKAMHEEPARRYSSPAELAMDLSAWLGGHPVVATADSFLYRARRFAGRNRWPVAIVALAFLATSGSALVALNQARNADRRFREVRSLANVFLFDFENAIHNLTGATKARELVIETASRYLDSLNHENSGDPVLQRELADAYRKLAQLQGGQTFSSTGNRNQAIDSFRKSLELRKALGDPRSANPELRRLYVVISSNLVAALVNAQRSREGRGVSEEAVAVAEGFARTNPAAREAIRSVYVAHHSRSLLCLELGDADCALTSAQHSLDVIKPLAESRPDDRRLQLDAANAEFYLAQADTVYGRVPGAREAAGSLTSRMTAIEKKWPPTPESRRLVFFAWSALGLALAGSTGELTAQTEEAVQATRRFVDVALEIQSKDPANTLAFEDLMQAYAQLGGLLAPSRPAEAVGVLSSARKQILAFSAGHKDDFVIQKTLVDVHNDLGLALRLTGNARAALPEHLAALEISNRMLLATPQDAISRKAAIVAMVRAAAAESELDRGTDALARLATARQALQAFMDQCGFLAWWLEPITSSVSILPRATSTGISLAE